MHDTIRKGVKTFGIVEQIQFFSVCVCIYTSNFHFAKYTWSLQVAEVCVSAMVTPSASDKIVEVVGGSGRVRRSIEDQFESI